MITIIEHGFKTITEKLYDVQCQSCGCRFTCEFEDFSVTTRPEEDGYFAKLYCPDCGRVVTVFEDVYTEIKTKVPIDGNGNNV